MNFVRIEHGFWVNFDTIIRVEIEEYDVYSAPGEKQYRVYLQDTYGDSWCWKTFRSPTEAQKWLDKQMEAFNSGSAE